MLSWTLYEMMLYPPTTKCFYPWICLLGLAIGNLAILMYTAGNVICACWHGSSNEIRKSVPGCIFWTGCLLAGACYAWDMAIVGIVNFNIKKPICEDIYHIVLLGHFIHGVLLVVSFFGMYIIIRHTSWRIPQIEKQRS